MNNDRLGFLLDTAANRRLTDAEDAELARLLEDPANRVMLDRELAPLRNRLGVLLDYHRASRAEGPQIPEARLEALLASLTGRQPMMAPKVVPFRRWLGPVMAVAAIAACLAFVVWYQKPTPSAHGVLEFAIVATIAPVRGNLEKSGSGFGPDWRVVPQKNLAALAAWAAASLPANVPARIWVDEEAEKLRAHYRRADGTTAFAESVINTKRPIEDQVKSFAAQLAVSP